MNKYNQGSRISSGEQRRFHGVGELSRRKDRQGRWNSIITPTGRGSEAFWCTMEKTREYMYFNKNEKCLEWQAKKTPLGTEWFGRPLKDVKWKWDEISLLRSPRLLWPCVLWGLEEPSGGIDLTFFELIGEAMIQLPTPPPLGPGFCHRSLETSQSPSSTITCLCPLELVLNTLNEFKDSYSHDSQISLSNLGLFWNLNYFYKCPLGTSPWMSHSNQNSTITNLNWCSSL